jgi:hypothetical protein
LLGGYFWPFNALVSGLIVAVILWLYALPPDLSWTFASIEVGPRFAVPLTAYLIGLPIAAILMIWAGEKRA